MITISPKGQYLALRKAEAEGFSKLIAETEFKSALVYAYAEFAMTCPNPDQLAGANQFIRTFLNIADPESQQKFPSKDLKTLT